MTWDRGPSRVKPKTKKMIYVASLLSAYHKEVRGNITWLGIMIMCPRGETCLPVDCRFSELAL
jgi:hypothetical protein